jgi:surface carbohydrate biosynthesis protein
MRPRVALIVDHPRRDLAGAVLTAVDLAQHGVVCHLVPFNLHEREIWALAPDLVMLNFVRRGTEPFAARLAAAGIKFGFLDTEGGVWSDLESYVELLWNDASLLKKTTVGCLWGPKIASHLVSSGIFARDQVAVTGCPRFDFYNRQWREVLQDRPRPGGALQTKAILVNTNLSFANSRFASRAQNVKLFREVFKWPEERIQTLLEDQDQALSATIELARSLSRDLPQTVIVVRPHPFENPEPYRKGLGHLSNIEVNVNGPVQPQIFRAAAVVQRSCTTGIEAAMSSVPTFSPQWITAPLLMPVSESVSVPCASFEELRSQIDAVLEGRYATQPDLQRSTDAVIHDWFYRADGLCHKRVSDAVLMHLQGVREVDERLCRRFHYGLNGENRPGIGLMLRGLRHRLRLSPEWSFRKWQRIPDTGWAATDKYFGVGEIRELSARISLTRRANGHAAREVTVGLAREVDGRLREYASNSVTLLCDE